MSARGRTPASVRFLKEEDQRQTEDTENPEETEIVNEREELCLLVKLLGKGLQRLHLRLTPCATLERGRERVVLLLKSRVVRRDVLNEAHVADLCLA